MKKMLLAVVFCFSSLMTFAQAGYEIKIDLKNYKEDLAYLTYFQFDKTFIKDTCTSIRHGKIIFKGEENLPTGIYSLVNKQKALLFTFFIDKDTQKLDLKSDSTIDFAVSLKALNSESQNKFLNYIKYISKQNNDFLKYKESSVLKTKKDTLIFIEKQLEFEKRTKQYEKDFLIQNSGSYIASVLNLKIEKVLKEVPVASNGRPDSIAAFNYYKNHYWDDVDFKDDVVMRNPFFYNKLKSYFDDVVPMHPDSINVEFDKILTQTDPKSMLFKSMLAHFTYSYETSPVMGFDKVFVYLADHYFKTGKAAGIYGGDQVVQRIIDRAEKLRPLLLDAVAPELLMINVQDRNTLKALGFESAKSSAEITKLYHENLTEITKLYVKLSDVKADYTVLVFWDADCSHCKEEIPVLLQDYNKMLQEHIDVKVYSVSVQNDIQSYIKYVADHQLPWINVYDGARINNTSVKYDVNSTPIIYILDRNKVIKAKRIAASNVKDFITHLKLVEK